MNILILVNNAIRMGEFHSTIGRKLEIRHNNVYYALTDRLMMYTENIDFGNAKNVFIFSEFFKEHYNDDIFIEQKYGHLNLNKWIYSEYDRNIKFTCFFYNIMSQIRFIYSNTDSIRTTGYLSCCIDNTTIMFTIYKTG